MTTPSYPTNPGNWPTLREQLLALETVNLVQEQQLITMLARELTARWYVSVMAPDWKTHFAFQHIHAGENPTVGWRPYLGSGGAKVRALYAHYGAPNSVQFGTAGRRVDTFPREDGYVDIIPAAPRNPAIWSAVVAEVSVQAEALIEELS